MMKTFLNAELNDINLNESGILSLTWVNEEKDLLLEIDWCGQNEFANIYDFNLIKTSLLFEFVTDLEISFTFLDGSMGGLEITEFSYSLEDNVWEVIFKFNFQPKGHMKFKCNDFKFIIESVISPEIIK